MSPVNSGERSQPTSAHPGSSQEESYAGQTDGYRLGQENRPRVGTIDDFPPLGAVASGQEVGSVRSQNGAFVDNLAGSIFSSGLSQQQSGRKLSLFGGKSIES
jgi:hypothetical protein